MATVYSFSGSNGDPPTLRIWCSSETSTPPSKCKNIGAGFGALRVLVVDSWMIDPLIWMIACRSKWWHLEWWHLEW